MGKYYGILPHHSSGNRWCICKQRAFSEKMDSVDDKWKDSMDNYNVMLVTIGRSSTENGTYLPGVDGVDASQNLNQTDPLGLSDDERDLDQRCC